ncbi:unnamed protein product [Didymodactylos carnosus]|uniref:Uncharacterized protein n=1 Tax=Didymodactylos carnosus TaxID=1234261 RepID=A0A815CDH8_9BILA|nr:unnamed protein product [Didymodactylos carnosus]CAF1340889.1 unnamed protein product [Didymodactylos carnosus]CAF4085936.1 unnamed protein product [Didymodactylos carnosus]CAF4152163.1 unnamed protein product [Didymodactylos carnosus]
MWIDSDPNVFGSTVLFQNEGWKISCFNETADAINALQMQKISPTAVKCIITSMMERGGRKERGLRNGLEMLDDIKLIWRLANESYCPLIAVISLTADLQQCKEHGVELVVMGDRYKLQREIISRLKSSTNAYYRGTWREPSLLPCQNLRNIAHDFLETLHLDKSFLDPFADRCFCAACEPQRIWTRSGEKYALPIGYYRYGIAIRRDFDDKRVNIENWPVAYHGTKVNCVVSIIRHRRIMFPGDILDDGTKLVQRLGQIHARAVAPEGGSVIYISPTIRYSQHEIYAPSIPFKSYYVKLVLQCRVKPNSFGKFPETLAAGSTEFDPEFKNNEIEWVTADRQAVVPYGLLIGVSK